MNITSNPKDCNVATAIPIAFSDLYDGGMPAKTNPALYGRCVTVSGIGTWRNLYSSVPGLYFIAQGNRLAPQELGYQHRAGILANERQMKKLDYQTLYEIDVFGRLYDCSDFTFMGSYCHYVISGPFLAVATLKAKPKNRIRFVGDTAREKYGNLDFVEASSAWKQEISSLSAEWLGAIKGQDDEAVLYYQKMHGIYNDPTRGFDAFMNGPPPPHISHFNGLTPTTNDTPSHEENLFEILKEKNTAFQNLREIESPKNILFTRRKTGFDIKEDAEYEKKYPSEVINGAPNTVYSCYCLEPDCVGKWPISTIDITNQKDLPYVCVQFNNLGFEDMEWQTTTKYEASKANWRAVTLDRKEE